MAAAESYPGPLNPPATLEMRPSFDREEDYLIAYYRQLHATGNRGGMSGDLAVLLVSAALVGTGLFKDDTAWVIVGFGILAYRQLQGMWSTARYNRTLGSIIEKYETACGGPQPSRQTTPPAAD